MLLGKDDNTIDTCSEAEAVNDGVSFMYGTSEVPVTMQVKSTIR